MCDRAKTPEQIAQEKVLVKVLEEIRAFPADGKLQLIITNQTQSLPSPLPPYSYKGVRHTLESVSAMAELLKKHGCAEKSVVYFNDININAILDQTIQDRPFDTAVYSFEASPQASDWKTIFGRELNQKGFIKFLKSREPGEVPNVESLMVAAQKIKGNFKVITETEYVDSNNLGVVYKIEDQNGKTLDEGKMDIPTRMEITMSLLKESKEMFLVDVDLELTRPVDGRPPFFIMTCPRWATFWREAVEKAVEDLRRQLNGYLIVAGEGCKVN